MLRCLVILLLTSTTALAQPSDFLILKKKDKTIKSYYPGKEIEFTTKSGAYINAYITNIHSDTLFLKEYTVRQAMTRYGFYVADTLGSYSYAHDYRDIYSIGKKEKRGFNVQGSGAALLGGGILLTLASVVVLIVDPEKFSPALMGASIGLAGVGYLLTRVGRKGIIIGKKKYHLEYIDLSGEKK